MWRYQSYFLTEILLFGCENSSYVLRLMAGRKTICLLKRLPTLLAGKAFAVYERLPEEKKDGYKKLVEALSMAFGGDDMGKHIAMMSFRGRMRKPDEDI